MAIRSLPRRPSLEHLRNEAQELQRLVRAADPAALSRVREFHPRFGERADSFRLSDAQLTVARSYGHPSWPKLKTYVEALTAYTRDPHTVTPRLDAADEFLRLACLVYGGDDLSRPALAAQMLHGDPALAGRSIHTAAAVGDVTAAARLLAGDPSLATATGGPFGWEPLLCVAYSRLVNDVKGHSHIAVVRLLFEHGADPNAGYLWDGTYLFTALTGAFGYGEDAPNQPPTLTRYPLRGCSSRPGPTPTTTRRSTTVISTPTTTTSSCCSPMVWARPGVDRGRAVSASI